MPTFNELFQQNIKKTDSGGVSFNDFWGLKDDEIERRLKEQARQNKIASTQKAAEEGMAEAVKNTASKVSLLDKTKKYGKEATVDTAKGVGKAIASAYTYTAEGTARALGAGNETEGQKAATRNLDVSQQRILEVLRDPNIPQSRKDILISHLSEQNQELVKQAAQTTKETETATNPRRFAASALEVGLTPLSLSPVGLTKAGVGLAGKARTAAQLVEGATFGTLGAAQQEKLTPGGIATGVAAGLAIPAGGAVLKRRTAQQAAQQKAAVTSILDDPTPTAVVPVADRAAQVTTRLDEINARLNEVKTGGKPKSVGGELDDTGKVFYHGTNDPNLKNLSDLQPGKAQSKSSRNRVYVTENPEIAKNFGNNVVESRLYGKHLNAKDIGIETTPGWAADRNVAPEFADYKTSKMLSERDKRVFEQSFIKDIPNNTIIEDTPNIHKYLESKGYTTITVPRVHSDVNGLRTETIVISPKAFKATQPTKGSKAVGMADSSPKASIAAEVKILRKERQALTAELKNIKKVQPVSQLDDVNRRISEAQANPSTTPQEAMALKTERDTIRQNIVASAPKEIQQQAAAMDTVSAVAQNSKRYADSGEHFAPTSARNQEARAIANNLAGPEGLDIQPTETRLKFENEANAALDVVSNDYEAAKRIALGQEAPPLGVQDTSVMLAVENRATREGDDALISAISQSPIHAELTKAGQRASVLADVNPESPVNIMRYINKVRKNSPNPNVPKFVTAGESKQLVGMARDVALKKDQAIANIEDKATRLAYGEARVKLDNYVDALTAPALKRTPRQLIKEKGYARATGQALGRAAGSFKSIVASLDNSAIGRQGYKVFWNSPRIWAKNSLKSFDDIVKQFGGREVKDALKADIISRPNSLNGYYKRLGVDVIDITEEAFPDTLPEKIWGVGRAFKASDVAYTGFVQRSRADLADKYIQIAKKTGVNLADSAQTKSIGKLVNALTGRGFLKSEKAILNKAFFSPALMKSHFDTLTAHSLQGDVTPFVRKQAAWNLLKMASGTAAILKLADAARPGSVEWDPRSANFGNIKIGNTRFNVTGGASSMAVLASRLATLSTKSSTSGDVTKLNSGKNILSQTGLDVVENFFENKTAPVASVVRDILKGEDFEGNPTNAKGVAKNLFVPLSVANYFELKDKPESANKLVASIADALGIATNTYGVKQADWRTSASKELTSFKESVPEQKFLEANDRYNEQYNKWLKAMETNTRFQKLNTDDRTTVRSNKQNEIRTKILKDYGFRYKREDNKDLKGF